MGERLLDDLLQLIHDWTLDGNATITVGSFVGLLVQFYFIHRTFILSRNWYFLVITSLTGLGGFTASIVLCVMVSNPNGYDALPYLLAANTMIIGTTVADGLITGFTCFYFLKQSRIARFSGTKELLARLIAVSMQSAAPPLICALIHLVGNTKAYPIPSQSLQAV
ncbi:hypothetical protein FRC08_013153 [Ceratobasidium sp. 394]|nr:hypothetical protein FRC08_013153 [Ceratobasidium sp. 394]